MKQKKKAGNTTREPMLTDSELTDVEETDDEETDTAQIIERRKQNKEELLDKVENAMRTGVAKSLSLYEPDQRSRAWAKLYFIPTILQNNLNYVKMTEEKKEQLKDQVEKGIFSGTKVDRVAATAFTYYLCAKKILGFMQVREGKPLQMWMLTEFKTGLLLRLYEKKQFVDNVLSKFASGATKKHALSAYSHLIKAVLDFLGSGEGKAHFKSIRLGKQGGLSEAEFNLKVELEKVRNNNLLSDQAKSRLNGQCNQEIAAARAKMAEFKQMFEPKERPSFSSCISAYLKSPSSKKLFLRLRDMAEDPKGCPRDAKEMNGLTHDLAKRLICQTGHRPDDAYGAQFTLGAFDKACHDGPALHPYKLGTAEDDNTYNHHEFNFGPGKALRIRDAHRADPRDPQDMRNQQDEQGRELFENLQGRCVKVRLSLSYLVSQILSSGECSQDWEDVHSLGLLLPVHDGVHDVLLARHVL